MKAEWSQLSEAAGFLSWHSIQYLFLPRLESTSIHSACPTFCPSRCFLETSPVPHQDAQSIAQVWLDEEDRKDSVGQGEFIAW